ncbi:tRNA (adenosine(37)-N6)-threonylcarbamoyltransferase complex dimerization subunit type 1 TsaB [Paenibacillus sp. N1-5-1-14]|uniref:tRNA (adenosine(37)-N6)-threonylcarbamoyltransferase complex dimerization subunit type 1 TsaB n=1 Tax=Paenibacillus radicibacter TaxID=2972488 RepID=UPI0021593527|nr:tRNA (adenosine(37)-N6)-threonylcarbamoyltransferase complex dimerization subunit type 1 TsaB [Paenibacillus radicibacter]MCR8643582.1 tRNA (adenosine(37)-N6)-threonylcarbamoyltransferase complex dimerization subunit type 1 TsaB [Paenibacillus radicibacter]
MDNNNQQQIQQDGYLLAMDTSTATIAIALYRGGVMMAEQAALAARDHSRHLLPLVQSMLEKQNMKIKDLSAIGIGVGPGSYTGVRIGITAAKTFAWAQQIPVFGISSLEVLAFGGYKTYEESGNNDSGNNAQPSGLVSLNFVSLGSDFGAYGACSIDGCEPADTQKVNAGHSSTIKWVIPLVNARRGQAYTSLFAAGNNGEWSALVPDKIRLMSTWCEQLLAMLNEPNCVQPQEIIFVGEYEGFEEEIATVSRAYSGKFATWSHQMRGRDLAELANRCWQAGEPSDNVHNLVPNYTQMTEAENNLRKLQKEQG